jgi:hemin uptake protein HemP
MVRRRQTACGAGPSNGHRRSTGLPEPRESPDDSALSTTWGEDEDMHRDTPSRPGEPISHLPGRQRTRIHIVDLMQGAREVILLHEGEEYRLRITKAGKLILTK